jgi:hypothetical protein
MHSSGLRGHSGVSATYNKVKALFAWPRMKHDISEYISRCQVCQQAKPENSKLPSLLQPLPIPEQAWHTVSLDFVEGLPKSKSFDTVLLVIDILQIWVLHCFISPIHYHVSSSIIPHQCIQTAWHSTSYHMIGTKFTSEFWKELFCFSETTLNMSSSYDPQIDGQTERLNQCLETYLRSMINSCPTKWSQCLPLAEFWYNTTPHSAHDRTPFQVLYGHCWWSIYHMSTTNISCIFISHVYLSMLICFTLMSSTSFDEFVRKGAHKRKWSTFGHSGQPFGHIMAGRPPTWPKCHVIDPGDNKHSAHRS